MSLLANIGIMSKVVSPPSGTIATPWTGASEDSGWNGYSFRCAISPTAIIATGTTCRLKITAGSGTITIGKAYIGDKAASGNAWDFATTPIQVLFSGNPNITISPGVTVYSDMISYPVTDLVSIIGSFYFSGATQFRRSATAGGNGWVTYYTSGDFAAAVTPSGFSTWTTDVGELFEIEVF